MITGDSPSLGGLGNRSGNEPTLGGWPHILPSLDELSLIQSAEQKRHAMHLIMNNMISFRDRNSGSSEIATTIGEVDQEHTMVYVGHIEPGLFDKLPKEISHIYYGPLNYESLYNKVEIRSIGLGGANFERLKSNLGEERSSRNFREVVFFNKAGSLIHALENKVMREKKAKEQRLLVDLKVGMLFNDQVVHSYEEIVRKGQEVGLKLCNATDALYDVFMHGNGAALNIWRYYMMDPISDDGNQILRDGASSGRLFYVDRTFRGLYFHDREVSSTSLWYPEERVIFRRK